MLGQLQPLVKFLSKDEHARQFSLHLHIHFVLVFKLSFVTCISTFVAVFLCVHLPKRQPVFYCAFSSNVHARKTNLHCMQAFSSSESCFVLFLDYASGVSGQPSFVVWDATSN